MHSDGFIILLIVFMGLVSICRGGKWNWKVIQRSEGLNAVFWFGWFSALFVSLLRLSGLG
jgi:hypothetical protein